VRIEDISAFAHEQRTNMLSGNFAEPVTPCEDVYPVEDETNRRRLGVS
jgi:hypothetical protein